MSTKLLVPVNVLQTTINYLKTRPYDEVANLIDGLVKQSEIPVFADQPKTEPDNQLAEAPEAPQAE